LESDLQLVLFVGSGSDQVLPVESHFNLMACVVSFTGSTYIEPLVSVNFELGGTFIERLNLFRRQIQNLVMFLIRKQHVQQFEIGEGNLQVRDV
jgi:hypothetical protein